MSTDLRPGWPTARVTEAELPEWIISDTHFGHANINRYCDRPPGCDQAIQAAWRHAVASQQSVLHLGDVYFGKDSVPAGVEQLPGKVSFIAGNHDRLAMQLAIQAIGWRLVPAFWVTLGGYNVAFTHYPLLELEPRQFNVHGHIHNNVPEFSIRHLNCSVEVMAYRPRRIRGLIRERVAILSDRQLARQWTQDVEEFWSRWPSLGEIDSEERARDLRRQLRSEYVRWRWQRRPRSRMPTP